MHDYYYGIWHQSAVLDLMRIKLISLVKMMKICLLGPQLEPDLKFNEIFEICNPKISCVDTFFNVPNYVNFTHSEKEMLILEPSG